MGLKKKKLQKGKNKSLSGLAVGGGEDRITNLPDCLIHHILSFLLIEDVVRTTVLSKRWNSIFRSIPILNIRGLEDMRPRKFMYAVDRILHLHDMSKIQSLCIDFSGRLENSRVNLWISAAVMRDVEKLDLHWSEESGHPFHLSLFTCESLITLKLSVYAAMYLPKYMSCPRLKHLHLQGARFDDEYNNEQLFSSCPVLEELILEECDWSCMRNFCISAPALKILKIRSVDPFDRWDDANSLEDCGFKIDAPNLVALTYKCDLTKKHVVHSLPALVDADLDFNFGEDVSPGADATRFFEALLHVKCLSISDRVLLALSYAKDLENHLPTFHHLKQLNVELQGSIDEALIALLQSAPNLESLVFNENWSSRWLHSIRIRNDGEYGVNHSSDDGEYGVNHSSDDDGLDLDTMTTGCFLLHLKSVCFKAFTGTPREMSWVKLILKNAQVLQTMTVFYASCTHYSNVKSEEEFLAEVPTLFTASKDLECQISFMDCQISFM